MDIGNKIKQMRTRKGLTLEELASRSELTKGFLSQLERDLTSPSIDSLSDILEALGSNLSEFFREENDEQFVFSDDDFFVDAREGCTVNWIVPNTQKNQMEPHGGEEFGYVLSGSIVLVCDGKRNAVRKGETFYLHGRSFHKLINEHGSAARVLWISTPPLF